MLDYDNASILILSKLFSKYKDFGLKIVINFLDFGCCIFDLKENNLKSIKKLLVFSIHFILFNKKFPFLLKFFIYLFFKLLAFNLNKCAHNPATS